MKTKIKKNDIAWRIIEGQAFIVNTTTSTLHELDETGTFIWKLLETDERPEDIAVEISLHFDVSGEQALKDTEEFIVELEKKGILEIR